jgi:hypothetical protein
LALPGRSLKVSGHLVKKSTNGSGRGFNFVDDPLKAFGIGAYLRPRSIDLHGQP